MSRKGMGRMVVGLVLAALAPVAGAAQGTSAVVDRLQAAYRDGSVQRMLAVYAEDATFEDVNQRHLFTGTEQLQAMLSALVSAHLHMDLEETRRVVSGDTAVVEYSYEGQLNGAVLGAAVGKEGCPDLTYEIPVTSWFRVKHGKIVHQKDFLDWATFLDLRQQMLAGGRDITPGATEPGSR